MADKRTLTEKMHGCIVEPCAVPRKAGSGFCPKHKQGHEKSPWTKAWKKYMADVSKVGMKKAVFVSPNETKVVRDAPVD